MNPSHFPTIVRLYRLHGGFANRPGGWSLDSAHMDEMRGDYPAEFVLPEGYCLGETVAHEVAVFTSAGAYCDIVLHPTGRPQLIPMIGPALRTAPVLEQQVWEALRTAADGHAGEQDPDEPGMSDGAVIGSGTLEECRQAIRATLTRLDPSHYDPAAPGAVDLSPLRWVGDPDAGEVEAYYESSHEGCGGWAIRPAGQA